MKKLFLCAATLVALATQAQAGGPGVPTGAWCAIKNESEASDWMFFKRGKCSEKEMKKEFGATLILKPNGDYILFSSEHELRCKVDPKSYFKGWADYTCTFYGGGKYVSKHSQKFVMQDKTLGRSNIDLSADGK
jgi:hypothetical protein